MRRFLISFMGLLALMAGSAIAEPVAFYLPEGTRHDPAIPTPESVLGFGLGERPVRHDRLVDYIRLLAERSPRMTIETIGHSHEGRPIEFLVVTSPANHARLESLRAAHRALSDDPAATAPSEGMPVVTWLNYGVHGAESAGMDAVIPVLYHLAAAEGEAIERTLANSIILITAIFNPDGHSRRIDHVERFSSMVPVTDPASEVHNLWMTARTNHYWFDLNRQWLLQTQPESRAWLAAWQRWRPNVSVDFHEMGSNATYYFHPGEPRRKNPLIPDRSRRLLQKMAGFHAASLDEAGYLYYTEEGFDNYYIGKGSTYPHLNGSIGILFEAAAARGGAIETPNGMRTLALNIRHHVLTSLSSIAGAEALRGELLAYQRDFYRDSLEAAGKDPVGAWLIDSHDRARLEMFRDLLARHDINVHELARDVRVGDRDYRAGRALIVPLAQRQYAMIRGIFDRVKQFEEAVFYDVSGWTLPLAYDLDHAPLARRAYRPELLGATAGRVTVAWPEPAVSDYGYMLAYDEYFAPRALYRLLDEGLLASVALKPFEVETPQGRASFARGAIFIPLAGQTRSPQDIHRLVIAAASEAGIEARAVTSGLTPTEGVDLGARQSFAPLARPSVLLFIDDGVPWSDAGEIWHLLDHDMRIPVTLRQKDRFSGLDWSRYSHVVLAGARLAPDDRLLERLGRFVREEGGVLIATRAGAVSVQKALFGHKAEKRTDGADKDGADVLVRRDYAEMPLAEAVDIVGGAVFGSDLDITHPLAFGHRDRAIASHRNMTAVLETPENPYAMVARYLKDDPVLSGYASDKRKAEIAGTPMLIADRLGRGSVILFADDPVFRASYPGTARLFLNAIFFGKAFVAPGGGGEAAADEVAQ